MPPRLTARVVFLALTLDAVRRKSFLDFFFASLRGRLAIGFLLSGGFGGVFWCHSAQLTSSRVTVGPAVKAGLIPQERAAQPQAEPLGGPFPAPWGAHHLECPEGHQEP